MGAPNSGPRIVLNGVSQVSSDTTAKIGLDKLPVGAPAYVMLGGRSDGTNGYRTKIRVETTGRVLLYLVRLVNGVEANIATPITLPATTTYAVGEQLNVRTQVEGTSPTTVRAKVWEVGTPEPAAWQLTASDSTAGLQSAGALTFVTYLGNATNAPVTARFDDLQSNPLP
jgi:hypothetical protein